MRRQIERAHFVTPEGARSMVASYYGGGERLNAHTATGERFNAGGYTAAHRSLPFGTRLTVCLHGCVTVRVNDRGPAAWTGRSLDLARGAAARIGMIGAGVARVSVRIGG
ncbi:septal ring lytic transglycosylase RlpA family protein [Methylocystis sp. WRRC1]|nr:MULTISPECIES: septal ring lytic transglycosylase RlpA family protein [unclassified Methylocystis]MCC3246163.1 septal ring lytic transglycosylase RlpA family protein [Methylocystis sp. WRRC1]